MSKKVLGLISGNYNDDSFGQLTAVRSLASLPFGGRYRLMDFALSNMVNSGLRTIGLITPFYYRSITDHVGAGKDWSLSRKRGGLFIMPGSIYGLKSMRSVFLLRDIIKNRMFIDRSKAEYVLLSGSNKIYNLDLRPLFAAHEAAGGGITLLYKRLAGEPGRDRALYLDLDSQGQVIGLGREPGQGNCFIDCFMIDRRLLLEFIDSYKSLSYIDLTEIISNELANLQQVRGFEFTGYLGQVDNINDYMNCSQQLLESQVRSELFNGFDKIRTKIEDHPPTKYSGATHARNSLIPTGCTIEGTVENSILFRGVHIGPGAVVRNCVIMSKGVIEAGAMLENVICDKFVNISSGNKLSGTAGKPLVIPKGSQI